MALKKVSILPETRFINRTDAVERYMCEINKYEILPESKLRECLRKYKENGDMKARQKVFESCAKFVLTCAKKYQNPSVDFMDLVNAGNHGVLDAIEHFNLDVTHCKFVSYAMYYIRLYIHEALSECLESIQMPIKLKRNPDSYLESSPFRSLGKIVLQPSTFSMDTMRANPDSSGNDVPVSETIMTESSWNTYKSVHEGMDIDFCLSALDFTEREVIINIFGLYGLAPKTLEQCSDMFRLKKQKVIAIRDKAIKKMSKLAKV